MSPSQNSPPKPPMPPILPATINEQVFSPKLQMQNVKAVAQKRLKKFRKKFEKFIRKYLKKDGDKDRYLQFYDIGYRYEAVFQEITSDAMNFTGEVYPKHKGDELIHELSRKIKIPLVSDLNVEELNKSGEIVLFLEKDENQNYQVILLVALSEFLEIKRLGKKVEAAPRANNPGA